MHPRTHFVIADGDLARWVERESEVHDFVTVHETRSKAKASAHAGASHAGGDHHAFALQLAHEIDERAQKGVFDRFCLVAPARMIEPIASHLTPPTRAKLAHSLAKDLTKTPDHKLGEWLAPLDLA